MQRSIALLQLARSTAAWQGEISTALANRLLSNSQATTSAAYTQVRNARTVSKSSTRFQSGFRQPDDDQRDQQDSQTRRDGQSSNPSPADADRIRQQDQASEASEPEVGYVQDGPYPYSASEELEVINLAGSTETAWEFLGINEDENITWFGLDFTRGKVPEVERNALLSDSTKEMMYQMHSHDKTKYSVDYLAKLFSIRQQRVMAILTLKGMEHQTIPLPDSVHSRKEQASTSTSASTADTTPSADTQLQADDATAASADTAAGDPAVGDSEGLDSRAKIVKASMDEAAKEIPAYVKSITQQAETWQIQSEAAETPAERKTDSNILTAWLRHVAKDPFWLRPSREQREQETKAEKAAAAAAAERAEADAEKPLTEEEQRAAAKAEQELEQQLLQDEVQSQQRDRGSPESVEPSDPKTEGEERYLLSNPDYLSYIMENEVFDCHEFTGTGERHIKHIPRYPKFEYFKDDRPEALAADREAGGKANIDRPVLSFWETACEEQAAKEEVHLIRDFKERLRYNLQQTGAKIDRNSRSKNAPSRPKEGWSMVVQDVSKTGSKKQYVAMPGGKTRSLTADEQVYLDRAEPKKRKKIL